MLDVSKYIDGKEFIEEFIIMRVRTGYIIHNTNYNFHDKHTHIRTKNTAIMVVNCVINKKIPLNLNSYLLTSMTRISDDEKYIIKINKILETRKRKGKKLRYCNKKW